MIPDISPREKDSWEAYQDAKDILSACDDAARRAMAQMLEARAKWWADVKLAGLTRPALDDYSENR